MNLLKLSTQCRRDYHLLVEEGTLDENISSSGFPVLKCEEFAGSSFAHTYTVSGPSIWTTYDPPCVIIG